MPRKDRMFLDDTLCTQCWHCMNNCPRYTEWDRQRHLHKNIQQGMESKKQHLQGYSIHQSKVEDHWLGHYIHDQVDIQDKDLENHWENNQMDRAKKQTVDQPANDC